MASALVFELLLMERSPSLQLTDFYSEELPKNRATNFSRIFRYFSFGPQTKDLKQIPKPSSPVQPSFVPSLRAGIFACNDIDPVQPASNLTKFRNYHSPNSVFRLSTQTVNLPYTQSRDLNQNIRIDLAGLSIFHKDNCGAWEEYWYNSKSRNLSKWIKVAIRWQNSYRPPGWDWMEWAETEELRATQRCTKIFNSMSPGNASKHFKSEGCKDWFSQKPADQVE